jgi:ATP-dependent HslUV protease subunit HslV
MKPPLFIHGTTVIALRHKGASVMAADGQVTLQNMVVKTRARKVRSLSEGKILAGFAGASADAFTLLERFEAKLRDHGGVMARAAVELAKDWRTDRVLRRLEALMITMDGERMFLLSGTGDVIEPDDNILAIGSGGAYALAAARALIRHADLTARQIVQSAMEIASGICVFTNSEIIVEEIPPPTARKA